MEGTRSNTQPLTLLMKIKGLTFSIVEDLARGRAPFIYIDRFRNYCTDSSANCSCSSILSIGKEALSLKRECHARRFDVLLRVLLIVQQLLQENRHGSKRDIYYMHPTVFKEQSVVDRAINDICILLQCSRHNLNVVSVGNGLVMGWLRYAESGRKIDCISNPNTAYPIPVHVEEVDGILTSISIRIMNATWLNMLYEVVDSIHEQVQLWVDKNLNGNFIIENVLLSDIVDCLLRLQLWIVTSLMLNKDIISVAQYILVVEKESVFQRLANDQFGKKNRCIVITGRGYPDVPTRRFMRLLVDKLHLPVYCLVDCDPYGFDILTTYKFGSLQMAYDAMFLRVSEIQWLGVFIQDCENYSIPQQCLLPLTTEDKRKVEAMLLRCYLQREVPKWRLELELLLHRGVKFEIEALSVHALTFLSHEYLPSKIHSGGYI